MEYYILMHKDNFVVFSVFINIYWRIISKKKNYNK